MDFNIVWGLNVVALAVHYHREGTATIDDLTSWMFPVGILIAGIIFFVKIVQKNDYSKNYVKIVKKAIGDTSENEEKH